ncbi:MAG TPA: hypothetical protein VIF09_19470 [Polyangiaceae bacterium]
MRPRRRRLWLAVAMGSLGAATYACSLLTSYDGFAGGACFACVDPVPPGWSGPVALFESTGTPPVAAPGCSGAYPTAAYQGSASPAFAPGACACTCSVAAAPGCTGTVESTFTTGACGSPSCLDAAAPGGTCLHATACPPFGSLYVSLGGLAPAGGTCVSHPDPLPSPTWSASGQACALSAATTGGSCEAGQTCAPSPPDGFDRALCIFSSGDVACPGPPFVVQHLFYADFDDQRDCGCSCGTPEGGVCNATVHVFDSGACAPPGTTVAVTDPACTYLGPTNAPVAVDFTSQGATCAPVSGQITGAVTGTSPTTVCCTQ